MAHRALVAVARDAGGYALSLATDGAADWLLEPLLCPDARVPDGLLDGRPVGRADSVAAVFAAHLDADVHEALVVVDGEGRPTPYVVVPFVLATAEGLSSGERPGAAVALLGHDGDVLRPAYVRGWRHGAADLLGEVVDAGLLHSASAFGWFEDAVRRLGGGAHEVVVLPPEG